MTIEVLNFCKKNSSTSDVRRECKTVSYVSIFDFTYKPLTRSRRTGLCTNWKPFIVQI